MIQLQDNDLISISKITYKFLDEVFWVENYCESEDLSLKNYENLENKEKLTLMSNIKFIKNYLTNYNSSENDINIGDNHENDNITDNELSEDNNTLNNDSYILDENINNNLFEISYDIYKEKFIRNKKRKFIEITNSDCDLISKV